MLTVAVQATEAAAIGAPAAAAITGTDHAAPFTMVRRVIPPARFG